jgi:hypothetical protein
MLQFKKGIVQYSMYLLCTCLPNHESQLNVKYVSSHQARDRIVDHDNHLIHELAVQPLAKTLTPLARRSNLADE